MVEQIRLSDSQRLLCRVLSANRSIERDAAVRVLLRKVGEADCWAWARANEVEALVAHALMDVLGGEHVGLQWQDAHQRLRNRIASYLAELDRVADRLAGHGIPVVALKNGGIARGIFGCPGCCPMGDLDVLVERKHFGQAHQILLSEGYDLEFRSPLEQVDLWAVERGGSAEYRKTLPNGETLWLELQWRPVAGRWIRPDQEPSDQALMARSLPIPGSAVRLLRPEDNLLQVALHTAKHSYVRAPGFRLHLDVERIVRAYPELDWQLFVHRVEALQVKTAVYFSLALAKLLFETPIPEQVLRRLKPVAWKEAQISRRLERAGLFFPHERKFNTMGYILFTALLYDDGQGVGRALFPGRAWMRERYGEDRDLLLPYYYGRRLLDLAVRRVST